MLTTSMTRTPYLTLAIVLLCLLAGKDLWRAVGLTHAPDGHTRGSVKRAAIYQPTASTTVFIGACRHRFGPDLPTWEQLTGEMAVHYQQEGVSPLRLLYDLAADPAFKGKVLIEVAEPLFFSRHGTDALQQHMRGGAQNSSNLLSATSGTAYPTARPPAVPLEEAELRQRLAEMRTAIENIRGRGGKVIFLRTPSSKSAKAAEQTLFPREKYWDRLLDYTASPGIHYEDYDETAHFSQLEWSHLKPADAIDYTSHIVRQMSQYGWFSLTQDPKLKIPAYTF